MILDLSISYLINWFNANLKEVMSFSPSWGAIFGLTFLQNTCVYSVLYDKSRLEKPIILEQNIELTSKGYHNVVINHWHLQILVTGFTFPVGLQRITGNQHVRKTICCITCHKNG